MQPGRLFNSSIFLSELPVDSFFRRVRAECTRFDGVVEVESQGGM